MDKPINKMIYTNNVIFTHLKEGNSAICDNMDKLWRHYAKWNKSVTKGQILMIPLTWGT